jgi:hypothetical protein
MWCKTLRVGKKEKQLGNHVCQFVFLGLTGFRFPFAHFVSDQIQAYDLHVDVFVKPLFIILFLTFFIT